MIASNVVKKKVKFNPLKDEVHRKMKSTSTRRRTM